MDRDSARLTQVRRRILFLLFFVSGACGLLYQIVWLRLAFASFGVITPVLSVVIAIFMLGLALGSWGAGKWVGVWSRTTGLSAIYSYAAAEVLIGASAFAVPSAFRVGESWLLPLGETDSFAYLLYSALILAGSILPACIAMGTTYPLMLAPCGIGQLHHRRSRALPRKAAQIHGPVLRGRGGETCECGYPDSRC
jgi:predicted membrane-bound spermidine synthase